MKFTLFWSSPRILWAIWTNKFLSGEFHVFLWKNDHYWLWALPWKFGSKIKLNRMKFILFMVMGTYTLGIDWVASLVRKKMAQCSCHTLQSF